MIPSAFLQILEARFPEKEVPHLALCGKFGSATQELFWLQFESGCNSLDHGSIGAVARLLG